MKRITIITLVLGAMLLATPVQAQFCWGIKGGVNLGSKDITILADQKSAFDMSNYTGFFIGPKAEVSIPLLGFGVEVAALYAQKGMTLTDNETFEQNSFLIPLNVKYAFGLGNVANVFIAAGPEFGFNVGETEEFASTLKFGDGTARPTKGAVQGYVAQKSTLAINVGLGVTLFNHFQVGINYNMPWGKTGEFVYIEAAEIDNAENIRNGENITREAVETLAGTADKFKNACNNIEAGTIQVSVAYLF